MLDRHEAQNDQNNLENNLGHDVKHRDAAGDRNAERPLADREVPLGGMAAADDESMMAIHQWLDGDLPEADARRADAKQVALWNTIADETARRRRMVTPAHVAANIMNAIPDVAVSARATTNVATDTVVAPAAERSSMSIATMMVIGTAVFALGIIIGKML